MAQIRLSVRPESSGQDLAAILAEISRQVLLNLQTSQNCSKSQSNYSTAPFVFEFHTAVAENKTKSPAEIYNERKHSFEYQQEALVYIIVVMLFYSITIVSLMIKYMKQEQRTANDNQLYQDFLTKTRQVAKQQAKADLARRVSLQLVSLAHVGTPFQTPDQKTRKMPVVAEEDVAWSDSEVRPSRAGLFLSPCYMPKSASSPLQSNSNSPDFNGPSTHV